jgi:hypothetical protein
MAFAGKNVRVYIQMDDKMFDISGDVQSFTISQPPIDVTSFGGEREYISGGMVEMDVHMIGRGAWSLVDDFAKEAKKIAKEWKCDFCGHVNPIQARYCGHKDRRVKGCGARRSFILDMNDEKYVV